MASISSWIKDWIQYLAPISSDSTVSLNSLHHSRRDGPRVAESLLTELTAQIRALEERDQEREQDLRRIANGGVDYSWLIMHPPKSYSLSEMEMLELEGLCSRVTPDESGHVIRMFRNAVQPPRSVSVYELPGILRAVIRQTIDGRPVLKQASVMASSTEWLGRSVASLRSLRILRSNVVSVGSEDCEMDVEMQSCDHLHYSSSEELHS